MTVSYGGLYKIALKATALMNLILNRAEDTRRGSEEGLNPGAVGEGCEVPEGGQCRLGSQRRAV